MTLLPESHRRRIRVRDQCSPLEHAREQLVQVERLRQCRELPRPAKLELRPPQLVRLGCASILVRREATVPDRKEQDHAGESRCERDDERGQRTAQAVSSASRAIRSTPPTRPSRAGSPDLDRILLRRRASSLPSYRSPDRLIPMASLRDGPL